MGQAACGQAGEGNTSLLEAHARLHAQDESEARDDVSSRHIDKLREIERGQFDAVVSWTSHRGEGTLKSSILLKKMHAGQHEEVPDQMKRWHRAGDKVLKGLERCWQAEVALDEMRW